MQRRSGSDITSSARLSGTAGAGAFMTLYAVIAELSDVPLRGRMLPHAHIHGRRGEHALVGREEDGGGEIVAETMRHLGKKVGGRWRDHDQVDLTRKTDMPDLRLVLEVEQVGEHLLLGKHGEGQRRDKLGAAFREDGAHTRAALLQAANKIEALIGGDAAAYDEQDALSLHFVVLTLLMLRSGRRPRLEARASPFETGAFRASSG